MTDFTAIIIVLYNPPQIKHIVELSKQLSKSQYHLIIVDNSRKSNTYVFKDDEVVYIFNNGYNLGIAEAQNIGIREAIRLQCKYIIFIDQDTSIDISYIKNIRESYINLLSIDERAAVLGPSLINKSSRQKYKMTDNPNNYDYVRVRELISSGSITCIEFLYKIGSFNKELFIDYVDFEWCWRAISLGYNCYYSSKISITHKVGAVDRTFMGYPIIVSSPIRYYYQYRNLLLLIKLRYVPLSWKVKTILRKLFEFLYLPLISNNKNLIIQNSLKGLKDGINNDKSFSIR